MSTAGALGVGGAEEAVVGLGGVGDTGETADELLHNGKK